MTISYSKDLTISKNDDAGYFKFSSDKVLVTVDKPAEDYQAACTVKCKYCQAEVKTVSTNHSFGDWYTDDEPDEDGYCIKSRVCSACGNKELDTALFASGDVDGDGTLTNADLTVAVRAISGWNIEGNVALIDANYDGKYNNRDIIALIRKLAGID